MDDIDNKVKKVAVMEKELWKKIERIMQEQDRSFSNLACRILEEYANKDKGGEQK